MWHPVVCLSFIVCRYRSLFHFFLFRHYRGGGRLFSPSGCLCSTCLGIQPSLFPFLSFRRCPSSSGHASSIIFRSSYSSHCPSLFWSLLTVSSSCLSVGYCPATTPLWTPSPSLLVSVRLSPRLCPWLHCGCGSSTLFVAPTIWTSVRMAARLSGHPSVVVFAFRLWLCRRCSIVFMCFFPATVCGFPHPVVSSDFSISSYVMSVSLPPFGFACHLCHCLSTARYIWLFI